MREDRLPAIELDRLSVAEMPLVYAIIEAKPGLARVEKLRELLDLVVEGGCKAIPLSQFSRYMNALDNALAAALGLAPTTEGAGAPKP